MATKKPPITFDLLSDLFDDLRSAVQAWEAQDGPNVNWQGSMMKAFSDQLERAFCFFLDQTADEGRKVDPDAYGPMLAIDELNDAYMSWVKAASMSHPEASPRGSDALWRAWESVKQSFEIRKLPHPPTVKTLKDIQRVSDNQIAIIYGWYTSEGEPDLMKVEEEYREPGTHYKKESWVHPSLASRNARLAAEWKAHAPRPVYFEVETAEPQEFQKPAPPSLEYLIEQGAPAGQIARLHGISEDEALAMLEAAGKLEAPEIVPANRVVAHEQRMAELDRQEAGLRGNPKAAKAKAPVAKNEPQQAK